MTIPSAEQLLVEMRDTEINAVNTTASENVWRYRAATIVAKAILVAAQTLAVAIVKKVL